jgi:CheY-like chemotaxis protein
MIMENENKEYFDLPTLLRQNDFNIRRFADKFVSSVDEYFYMLSKFIDLAPGVSGALNNFTLRNGDIDDYKSLDNMAVLLEDLGCDKFIADFYSILGAYEKGNWREAATCAKQITEDFNEFYLRIRVAKGIRALRDAQNPSALSLKTDVTQNGTLPLKEFIRRLDEEEANRKLLILAIDDSPVILKSVSHVLSSDYKVFTLSKPMELEKVLQKLTPELFLLDYLMPERNGLELVPVIKSFEEHKTTPIVFLTSEGTFDNVTAAIGIGANDFIVKPFKPHVLRQKIAKHIVRKKTF